MLQINWWFIACKITNFSASPQIFRNFALVMDPIEKNRIRDLLDRYAAEYNVESFAQDDPVQFPRQFDALPDREIASLLVSTIAWGRRPMILRDARRLLDLLEGEPHRFVLQGDIDSIPDDINIHRTFFGRHLKYYLRGLRAIYSEHPTLEAFARSKDVHNPNVAPAWALAEALIGALAEANSGIAVTPETPSRCLPSRPSASALKRLNLALRWLCRRDGIVDPGGWNLIPPSRLYIPMDVHVVATAKALGLLPESLRSPDRKSAEALTTALSEFRPDDPTVYDFALFGLGVNARPLEP